MAKENKVIEAWARYNANRTDGKIGTNKEFEKFRKEHRKNRKNKRFN